MIWMPKQLKSLVAPLPSSKTYVNKAEAKEIAVATTPILCRLQRRNPYRIFKENKYFKSMTLSLLGDHSLIFYLIHNNIFINKLLLLTLSYKSSLRCLLWSLSYNIFSRIYPHNYYKLNSYARHWGSLEYSKQ